MRIVFSCEIVTKNERRKRDWQRFLILLRGSSIAQLTWEHVPRDDMSVSDSCECGCGLSSVWGGRVRLGGGLQDFQCLNRIGHKIQVNFWMKVGRSQGDLQPHCRSQHWLALSMKFILGAWKKKKKSSWIWMFYASTVARLGVFCLVFF